MLRLSIQDPAVLAQICHALSTPLRLQILELLQQHDIMSCAEIARRLHAPLSTISVNVRILEDAGLLMTEWQPAKNGSQKLCSLVYSDIRIQLAESTAVPKSTHRIETDVPIGNYQRFEVHPSCGFIYRGEGESVGGGQYSDDPYLFLSPDRIRASLLWFRKGFVEYQIPVRQPAGAEPESITFSMELCSEAPGFNNRWKSDITMWIEGTEIGTWTSPADFGDRPGKLTPKGWAFGSTQYGLLTEWTVNAQGSFLNHEKLSEVTVKKLKLKGKKCVAMRIGVKEDARYVGGLNLFAEDFGDYPQGIRMEIRYQGDDA